MHMPNFQDVLLAQRQIHPYLSRTPLHSYPAINTLLGTAAYIKHENYQPVGAFKVRGGINLISQLSPQEREYGVIAASTGNQWHMPRSYLVSKRASLCRRLRTREKLPPCRAWEPKSSSTEPATMKPGYIARRWRTNAAIAISTLETSRCLLLVWPPVYWRC